MLYRILILKEYIWIVDDSDYIWWSHRVWITIDY